MTPKIFPHLTFKIPSFIISYSIILSFIHSLIFFSSCEEPIELPLRDADQQLVIEGLVTDGPGPHYVLLSQTQPLYDTAAPAAVSGALVRIADDTGNAVQLKEVLPGRYETEGLEGVVGRTYDLEVIYDDQTYTASSFLPSADVLDSVNYVYFPTTVLVPDTGYYLRFYARNDPDIRSFYLTRMYVQDTAYRDGIVPYLLFDDRFAQGQYINGFIVPFPVSRGDTARLEFATLTQEAYDFYFSWVQQSGSGSPFGAPPANISVNISGGALGFFRASVVQGETVVIR